MVNNIFLRLDDTTFTLGADAMAALQHSNISCCCFPGLDSK